MTVYRGTNQLKAFQGEYAPVNIYCGENKVAGWSYQSKTGTSVNFEETYNDSCALTLRGVSNQTVTVQNKNLLDLTKEDISSWLVTVSDVTANSLTLSNHQSSVAEGTVRVSYARMIFSKAVVGTAYTISANIELLSGDISLLGTPKLRVWLCPAKDTINGGAIYGDIINGGKATVTPTEALPYIHLLPYSQTAGSTTKLEGSVKFYNIQIERGAAATAYTPFVPDSPSLDYPSPIKSVADFDLVSSGKNLLDPSKVIHPRADTTSIWNGKILTVTGSWYIVIPMRVRRNTNYALRAVRGGPGAMIGVYGSPNGTSLGTVINFLALRDDTFNTGENDWICILFYASSGTPGMTTFTDIQVELGKVNTSYEPYRGQEIQLHLGSPLRSLPDGTKDYIEIDNVSGAARLVRNVGELVLNGTENWIMATILTNNYQFYITSPSNVKYLSSVRCTIARGISLAERDLLSSDNCVWMGTATNREAAFMYNKSTCPFATADAFKLHLAALSAAGTPVTVQYQLAVPIVTELDYQEVKTYYPYTQIYTTGSDILPALEARVRVMDS